MRDVHAVITGDLIGSSSGAPSELDRAMRLIAAAAQAYSPESLFHRYRGDGWQVYVGQASRGLGAMVCIAARLRAEGALSSRIALGLGEVNSIDSDTLGRAGGTAFVTSGRALDTMPRGCRLAIAGQNVDPLHHALIAYIDRQIEHWSWQQAEAVTLMLDPAGLKDQKRIAERLGIRRQALAARLNAGGFKLIDQSIAAFAQRFAQEPPHG